LLQTDKFKDESGAVKTNIYLCGKDLDGKIIKGMHAHYDKSMKKIRGAGLTDNEAADIAFTDVFVPCIVNNENDWLNALSKTYQVGGGREGAIVQNKEKFQDFVLNIKCRNLDKPDMPIEWKTFKGMNELREYISRRIILGHIDQPGVERFAVPENIAKNAKEDKGDNEFIRETITEDQGKKIGEVLRHVLREYANKYVKKYVNLGGGKATFLTILDKDNNYIPFGENTEGQTIDTFGDVVGAALLGAVKRGDAVAEQLLGDVYDLDCYDNYFLSSWLFVHQKDRVYYMFW
jgi:hypothetical protein